MGLRLVVRCALLFRANHGRLEVSALLTDRNQTVEPYLDLRSKWGSKLERP